MDDDKAYVPEEGISRPEEYFRIKKILKTLRGDLKDYKEAHEDYEELQKQNEKIKKLRENVKNDETIRLVQDKIGQLTERSKLLIEIIKQELLEAEEEEVVVEGKKLKLIQVLREVKEDSDSEKVELPK